MYYEQLKAGVIQHDLLVDNLIYKVHSSTPTGTTVAASVLTGIVPRYARALI